MFVFLFFSKWFKFNNHLLFAQVEAFTDGQKMEGVGGKEGMEAPPKKGEESETMQDQPGLMGIRETVTFLNLLFQHDLLIFFVFLRTNFKLLYIYHVLFFIAFNVA